MERGSVFRILAAVILLNLLLVAILGTPALAAPILNISPASGAVGTTVTVVGENFDSYKGDEIFIFFDNEEIAASPVTVPETGTFSLAFNIPAAAEPGKHVIRARSGLGSTLALSSFTVLEAEISLNTKAGVVGTKLVIAGQGFYANRVVTFYYNNRMLGTKTATATGEFSYSFTVPDSPAGVHQIVAKNAEGDRAGAEFEVVPAIVLSPTSGAAGEMLSVSGRGFSAKSDIAIYFRYNEVAYARSDEVGNFGGALFNVPAMPPDIYEVVAEDEDGNMAKANFAIIAGARLDKTMASVGTELTISGTGFLAGGTITIKYDEVLIAAIRADANGAFRAIFRVPPSRHGNHVIAVSDGISTRQLAFAVESEAPPAPRLLVPTDASEARAEARFDWEDVADPSPPVTYHFQIASDEDFTTIVLERKELASSEYTLSREERLQASSYYWRVRAIDGALNEGEWSAPGAFYVAAPPAPTLLVPEVGSKADAAVYFDWEDVSSLSPPVTYHLQVASDRGFTDMVLEKKGLTDSEYALSKEEKLAAVKKEFPYYWRVRAIDDALNEGEWSAPGSFYVGFTLPSWAIYTLIGFGAIIIGFLAFLLGRRTAYYET
ncbi:MAG TPA: hypothetical protein G4O01_09160 [Dehalococcoidia bacterium]|jgi:hypothetical protein|nr:hypothetical protein [Dehalococcoidia bacterium]